MDRCAGGPLLFGRSLGCFALLCLHAVVALCCVVDHLREFETDNASDNDDEMR